MKAMFTIDPGVSGTGWVSWIDGVPCEAGIIETATSLPWEERIVQVVATLMQSYNKLWWTTTPRNPMPRVVCEMMEYYQTGGGSAPWVTGDLQRILVLCGWFCGTVGVSAKRVTFVRPSEWKGQLPKNVVAKRVERIIGKDLCERYRFRSHIWDAAGIGLWKLGRF